MVVAFAAVVVEKEKELWLLLWFSWFTQSSRESGRQISSLPRDGTPIPRSSLARLRQGGRGGVEGGGEGV